MEIIKNALLALTKNVFHFTAAPGSAAPYIVYQEDGCNDLCAGNVHAETSAVVIVDLFTKKAKDPLISQIPAALESVGASWYLNSTQFEEETGLFHFEWYAEVI